MSRKEQLEEMLEQKAEELKEIHRQLQEEEAEEQLSVPNDKVPVQVQVAITTLRIIHKSLRMESSSEIEETKSEAYPNGSELKEGHRQYVRRLANSEARLRDACCSLISEYIDTARPFSGSHQTQDRLEDQEPSEAQDPFPEST